MNAGAQITFLPSSDLSVSNDFYEGVLGLELAVDQGPCRIYRVTDQAFVGVCSNEGARPTDGVIVTFVSDDVDAWCEQIEDAGGTILHGPEHSEQFAIYHAFVRDPDGNLLEIQRFDDPDWAHTPIL